VRGKFLAKGHDWVFSLEIEIGAVLGGAPELLQPWKKFDCLGLIGPPEMKANLEQRTGHLVSAIGPALLRRRNCAAQRPARCVSSWDYRLFVASATRRLRLEKS
jgi:hypothetical protein